MITSFDLHFDEALMIDRPSILYLNDLEELKAQYHLLRPSLKRPRYFFSQVLDMVNKKSTQNKA